MFQVDSFDPAYNDAKALAEEVRKSLQGYSGTNLGVNIKGIYLTGEFDEFEPEVENYRIINRFSVWHREAALS